MPPTITTTTTTTITTTAAAAAVLGAATTLRLWPAFANTKAQQNNGAQETDQAQAHSGVIEGEGAHHLLKQGREQPFKVEGTPIVQGVEQ
jgi:hypothetical protein